MLKTNKRLCIEKNVMIKGVIHVDINNYFPKIIRASLDNDQKVIRSLSMRIIRKLKETDPSIADEIAKALDYNGIGAEAKRSVGIESSPLDYDSRSSLITLEEPLVIEKPIYNEKINKYIDNFINERSQASKLIAAGLNPPSSLLIYGPPGVGKTYLAKYLSGVFQMKFATLNLSSVISSYLGKTGQNLKNVLDYARKEPTLLLLDEFDAVAKKRDDASDLGELKRIVNVLLKELEEWPFHSVIVAATNHSNLLDKAIWRRFDSVLEIGFPELEQKIEILKREFAENKICKDVSFLGLISEIIGEISAADICKIAEKTKRKIILNGEDIKKVLIDEISLLNNSDSVEFNKKFCKLAKENTNMSIRMMAELLGKSPSAIQYYLKGVN